MRGPYQYHWSLVTEIINLGSFNYGLFIVLLSTHILQIWKSIYL